MSIAMSFYISFSYLPRSEASKLFEDQLLWTRLRLVYICLTLWLLLFLIFTLTSGTRTRGPLSCSPSLLSFARLGRNGNRSVQASAMSRRLLSTMCPLLGDLELGRISMQAIHLAGLPFPPTRIPSRTILSLPSDLTSGKQSNGASHRPL